MSVAPANVKLRRAIHDVVHAEYILGKERVILLSHQGEVLDVLYLSQGEDILRRRRAEMLSTHDLAAVVHMSAAKSGRYIQVHVIEVFDDEGVPTRYAMTSTPDQHMWLAPADRHLGHWREVWGEEPPDEE